MKLGLHLSNFTYGVDASAFPSKLDEIVGGADAAGFDRVSVMDHYFQIPVVGPAEHEMFEPYGILGYIAARTSRVKLGVLATGVTYRNPGFLAKQVTGLDVLSRGRAWLGIGAAWYEREHAGLGFAFPPLRERYERLDEAIQICLQMWSDDDGPFDGKHYQLAETLCSPLPVQQPRPPIMVAGSGSGRRCASSRAIRDACNVRSESPEVVKRRFEILEQHCAAEGTDYDAIERTVLMLFDPGPDGKRAGALVETLGQFADVGVQATLGSLIGCEDPRVMEAMGRLVIPQLDRM